MTQHVAHRASDQIASLNDELRVLRAALDRAEAEKAEANRNYDVAVNALEQRCARIDSLAGELADLRAELAQRTSDYQYNDADIDLLNDKIAAAEAESDRLRAAYNDVRALNARITLNLGAELAGMREVLVKAKNFIYVNGQAPEDQELLNCIENALAFQSQETT